MKQTIYQKKNTKSIYEQFSICDPQFDGMAVHRLNECIRFFTPETTEPGDNIMEISRKCKLYGYAMIVESIDDLFGMPMLKYSIF